MRTKSDLCIASGSSEIRNKQAGKGTNIDIIQWILWEGVLATWLRWGKLQSSQKLRRLRTGCDGRLCFSKVSSSSFQSAYYLEIHSLVKALKNGSYPKDFWQFSCLFLIRLCTSWIITVQNWMINRGCSNSHFRLHVMCHITWDNILFCM